MFKAVALTSLAPSILMPKTYGIVFVQNSEVFVHVQKFNATFYSTAPCCSVWIQWQSTCQLRHWYEVDTTIGIGNFTLNLEYWWIAARQCEASKSDVSSDDTDVATATLDTPGKQKCDATVTTTDGDTDQPRDNDQDQSRDNDTGTCFFFNMICC